MSAERESRETGLGIKPVPRDSRFALASYSPPLASKRKRKIAPVLQGNPYIPIWLQYLC